MLYKRLLSGLLFLWSIIVTPFLVWSLFIHEAKDTISVASEGFYNLTVRADTNSTWSDIEYVSLANNISIDTESDLHVANEDYDDKATVYRVIPQAILTENGRLVQDLGDSVTVARVDSLISLEYKHISDIVRMDSLSEPFNDYDKHIITDNMVDSVLSSQGLTAVEVTMKDTVKLSPISFSDTSRRIDEDVSSTKNIQYEKFNISTDNYRLSSSYDTISISSENIFINTDAYKSEYIAGDTVGRTTKSTVKIEPFGTFSLFGSFYRVKDPNMKWKLLGFDAPFVMVTAEDVNAIVTDSKSFDLYLSNSDPESTWDTSRDSLTVMNVSGWRSFNIRPREPSHIYVDEKGIPILNTSIVKVFKRTDESNLGYMSGDNLDRHDNLIYDADDGMRVSSVIEKTTVNGKSILRTYSDKYGWGPCISLIIVVGIGPGAYVFRLLYEG